MVPQWRLDLHGLHADEAVQALKRRLQWLDSLLADQHGSVIYPVPHALQSLPLNSRSGEQNLLTRSLMGQHVNEKGVVTPGGSNPRHSLGVRFLSVIVGRGHHSSFGEAVLPRTIATYLTQEGYTFLWREGTIDIPITLPKVRALAHPQLT